MPVSNEYLKFVSDQLSDFGEFQTKKMFGGVNLFKDELMFAKIKNDSVWLKVDQSNLEDFTARGMEQYSYGKDNQKKLNFYEIPADIIEDRDQFVEWTKKAFEVAVNAKK